MAIEILHKIPAGRHLCIWILCLLCALLQATNAFAVSPEPGTPIVNRAVTSFSDATGNPYDVIHAEVQTIISGAPVLSIQKLESSDPVAAGGILTYTIQYENTGNIPATGVIITDHLSGNIEFQSASGGGTYNEGTGTVTWNLESLDSGQSGTLTLVVKIPASTSYGTIISNTIEIACAEGKIDQETITTTVGDAPNLDILKSATRAVYPGGIITYTIHYQNIGNRVASNVQLRDQIPSGTAYVDGSITGGGVVQERLLIWNLGDLSPGQEGTVEFQIKTSPLAKEGNVVQNTSSISCTELGTISSNTVATYVLAEQPLLIIKTATPETVYAGNAITYTIQVKNDGISTRTGVIIQDPIPENTSFVSADQGGIFSGNVVTWDIGDLASGEETIVHVVVQVTERTDENQVISNTATVSSNEITPQSATAFIPMICRTRPQIKFVDEGENQKSSYHVGDQICVQATDLDHNVDPGQIETVVVRIACPDTGDEETITLSGIDPNSGQPATNTGVFKACIPSSTESGNPQDGTLSVAIDTEVMAIYEDPLDSLCGYPTVVETKVLIDPYGVVFDSATGMPLEGAVVTLYQQDGSLASTNPAWPAGQPDSVTTGSDGSFAFPLVPEGNYYFVVIPGGTYVFPSIVPNDELPPGFIIDTGSRGEVFELASGMVPLNLDIPADPPKGGLAITKTANKDTASIGDIVHYTITVSNNGASPVREVRIIDTMPHGIQYLKGSTSINKNKSADPEFTGKNTIEWILAEIHPGESIEIVHRAVIGVDSQKGSGINRVYAQGRSVGETITSNAAHFKIKITEGVFTSKGTIIGKVFWDQNESKIQEEYKAYFEKPILDADKKGAISTEEHGVPGVVLYLEDGTRVVTDTNGKFSIYGVVSGTHVLKVDETTLPDNVELIATSNRFMGSKSSQFVDMTQGGLFKANFAVKKRASTAKDILSVPLPIERSENARVNISSSQANDVPLEEQILTMTPDLEFLSPHHGDVISKKHTDILIKAPSAAELILLVNNKQVPHEKIGKKVVYSETETALYEFVSIDLIPGKTNIIHAEIKDASGNAQWKEIVVATAGEPATIVICPEKNEIPADGTSTGKISVTLFDKNKNRIMYLSMITVSASAGKIIEEDIDPSTPGHQIRYNEGLATFTLKAPYESGESEIHALCDDIESAETVFFAPHLRDWFVSGIGEITLGKRDADGDYSSLKSNYALKDGIYSEERAAAFVKGKIGKDVLLTASYDSDKEEDEDELFRENDTNLETEDKYPIYGDESELGYEALSQKKLYVKVEKDKSYLMFGDYQTYLRDTKLSAYTRSFTGFKSDIRTEKFKLKTFGAETNQTQMLDTLRGQGISGYYYLTHTPVVDGSDLVVIETRDKREPDRVIKQEYMARGSDYSIDYEIGGILFKEPVPTYDEDFNPVYIIISYETEGEGEKYYIYGGRGAVAITPKLELGLTSITEEKAFDNYHLTGTDLTYKLPKDTTIKAEWAQTESSFDISSIYTQKKDSGWLMEIESKPAEKLSLTTYYKSIGDYFGNMSATDVMRGIDKYGFEATYKLGPDTTLSGNFMDETDNLNEGKYQHGSVGITHEYKKTKVNAGLSRETSDDNYVPLGTDTTREPFDNSEYTPDNLTAANVNIESKITETISALAGHSQDVSHNRYSISHAGLMYQINKTSRIYAKEEYGKTPDRTETRTIMGVESAVAKDTVGYNEYRLEDGADGSRLQETIGLRNKFMLGEKVTGNINTEHVGTVRGEQRQGVPDAFAIAGGLEYLPKKDLKLSSRLEYRNENSDSPHDIYLGEIGLGYKLNRDYSLLLKETYFLDDLEGNNDRITNRSLIGLAYRPINYDWFNGLAKLEYKKEKEMNQDPKYSTDSYITSIEGIYQVNPKTQLTGKYAGKLVKDDGLASYTDLVAGRILYDITSRFDVGADFRVLTSHDIHARYYGGSIEAGARVIENLWFSAGYSFDDFDEDLTGDCYEGKGPYVRIRFKFDEHTIKKLKADTVKE